MSTGLKSALLLAMLGLLSGCQLTAVEQLPAGATPVCPAEWRGAWIAVNESGRDEADFGVIVHDDCTVESRDHGNPHPARPPLPRPAFYKSGSGKNMVFFGVKDALDLIAFEDKDASMPAEGFVPLVWSRDQDRLSVRQPDHRRVATLIVQGALPGRVSWQSDHNSYSVIGGDPNAVADAFTRYDLFDGGSPATLRRVGDDAKALERALKRAAAAEKTERKR